MRETWFFGKVLFCGFNICVMCVWVHSEHYLQDIEYNGSIWSSPRKVNKNLEDKNLGLKLFLIALGCLSVGILSMV